MNSMQRQFGKLTHKGGGDDAKVSVLLQDFDEADKMLTKVYSQFEHSLERRLISADH